MKKLFLSILVFVLWCNVAHAFFKNNTTAKLEECIYKSPDSISDDAKKERCINKYVSEIPLKSVKVAKLEHWPGDYNFLNVIFTNVSTDYIITDIYLDFDHKVDYGNDQGIYHVEHKENNSWGGWWVEPGSEDSARIQLNNAGNFGWRHTVSKDIKINFSKIIKGNKWGYRIVKLEGFKIKETNKKFAKKDPPEKKIPKEKSKPKDNIPNNKILRAASGSGFFVSKNGNVVTNYHVIDGCKYTTINFNGSEIKTKTLAIDKKNDLAIINAKVSPKKIYQVSYEDAELLDNVIIAGYPLGKKVSSAIKTSKGSITALAGYGDNYSEFQTDAALNQGNSGGPIINEKNGNVIGVAVAAFGKTEGVESFNFGIKSSTLRTFASSNQIKFLPPNNAKLSNKELRELISNGTVYLECWMTYGKIKKMIEATNSQKAFFSEFK